MSDDGDAWKWAETEFTEYGSIYVPDNCLTKQCPVHFSFHDCYEAVEDYYTKRADLNGLAAANDIIVVYPGSKKCWNDEGLFDK